MDRRKILTGAACLALAAAAPRTLAAAGTRARVRPGAPGWPGEAQWAALRDQVGGALIRPQPIWSACEGADLRACAAAFRQLRNPYYLGDQAGGTEVFGYLDAWRNAPSAYAVRARSAGDVVAAVRFAAAHDLRLVVKGGGHSYFGGSNAPDSLLVWTRAMNAIEVHDAFVPRDCPAAPVPAVSVGAGAMWMDVYDAVTTRGRRYVQGGGCATVGVAGLVQGGGFGSFSKRYGLAAASLLEAEVVTADGALRIVNARREPGLFWALKGGGGGTFGVVTRLTLRTHDLPEWFGWASGKIKAASDAAFARLVRRFVDFYAEALCNPHWGEQVSVRGGNVLELSLVSQGLGPDAAREVWRPFLAWVAARGADYAWPEPVSLGARPAWGWWDAAARKAAGSDSVIFDDRPGASPVHAWWSGDQDQVSAFLHGYDSLWLPAALLAPDRRQALAEALTLASRSMDVGLHFNKGLAGAPPGAVAGARATAMNPRVADAFALAIVATGGPPPLAGLMGPRPDLAPAHRNAAKVAACATVLRALAPGAGSYVSEANFFNPRWQADFWGRNYPRLRAIKARYDPGGLFWIPKGVGSEAWTEGGFTRA